MTRLWLALVFLLTLPMVAMAQTGNEETICRNDPNVVFCENWADRPLGFPASTILPAQYKNTGWLISPDSTGGNVVSTTIFDGSTGKVLDLTTPANQPSGGSSQTLDGNGFDPGHNLTEMYWRMYERFQPGYIWSPVGTKNWENFQNGDGSNGSTNDIGFFLKTSQVFGGTPHHVFFRSVAPIGGTIGDCGAGGGAPCRRFAPNVGGSFDFNVNQWYCLEGRLKFNTPTTNQNGAMQSWVDGTLRWDYPNINIDVGTVQQRITQLFLVTYWNCFGASGTDCSGTAAHGALHRQLGNIIVSKARVGCLGAGPPTFTLTTSTAGTGSGTVTGGGSYAPGTVVTPTAVPAAGSAFTGWSGACSGTGTCNITMDANKTVTATFGPATSVYPPSGLLTNLSWDFAGKVQTGPGSDLWPTTWLTNDTLLGAFGDGGGANGTNTLCRTKFGINTFTGSPPNFTYGNLWGCKADGTGCDTSQGTPNHSAACDASFGGPIAIAGEPASIVAIGNTLYANYFTTPEVVIATSIDLGHTWTNLALGFTNNPGDFQPGSFVQYGAGYTGAIDGFLYMTGGKVNDTAPNGYLARVLPANIANRASWQWFTGTAASPSWGAWASATPFHADPGFSAGGGGTMQYFPGLGRFISVQSAGQLQQIAVYEAPNPWGPWSFVYSSNAWGPSGAPYGTTPMVSTNLMPKFITTDDATHTSFWMTFSGTGSFDSLNLIHGTFTRIPAASGNSENFNKADGALGPQMTWTNFGNNLAVVSNHAQATVPGAGTVSNRARSATTLTTQNQFVQGTVRFVGTQTGQAGAAVSARYAGSADESINLYLYTPNAGATYLVAAFGSIAGSESVHYGVDVDVTSLVTAANVLRLEIAGTSPNTLMVGYLNGTPVWAAQSQTTTTYDGNTKAGFLVQLTTGGASSSVTFDDFSFGDLAPGGIAQSCAQMTVAAAIDQASDGATVNIPAGDCTWTLNISTSKRLSIQGSGDGAGSTRGCGSCTAIIRDGTTANNFFGRLITWNMPGTGLSSMSGIEFVGSCAAGNHEDGLIGFFGDGISKQFRFHHNTIFQCGTAGMTLHNVVGGVIDHNSLHSNFIVDYYQTPQWGGVGDFGDKSYASPSSLGTDNALYWEDNDYVFPNLNFFVGSNDGQEGHRAVYRFNHYTNVIGANGHGTDSVGRERGFRHHEVYENDWTVQSNMSINRLTGFRGGTGLMFNNRATVDPGGFLNGFMDMGVDRAGASQHYEFWGRCGQYNVSLTSSGTTATATITNPNPDGHGHGFDLTGAPPVYVQFINATDSGYNGVWQVVIPAPFGNTFQVTTTGSNLPNATAVMQSPFDQNSNSAGYACLDQVGYGQSDDLGGTYTPTQTPPLHWPNQLSEPVYVWNNTKNGVVEDIVRADGGVALLENRDYYNQGAAIGVGPIASRPACTTTGFAWWATDEGNWNTTKAPNTSGRLYRCVVPNWSLWYGSNNTFGTGEPLTYPHPLVTGTPQPPAAPSNLRIVP